MNLEEMEHLIKVPDNERDEFKKMIHSNRRKLISSNDAIVEKVFKKESELISKVTQERNISETIHYLRERVYKEFLLEESVFNVKVLKELSEKLETPKTIMDSLINSLIVDIEDQKTLIDNIKLACGEYAGLISPYIYDLSLSNTQSRRSRAGKTFEYIIYKMYEIHGYPYVSQGQIGRSTFSAKGLGKMVDSLLPSIDAFEQRRDKVIIGTMKTTLRERWQEVIEEISRTGLPHIYLLTMDESISKQKATQMSKHNVVLVVTREVKSKTALKDMKNIISFEEYFLEEVPEKLNYWN